MTYLSALLWIVAVGLLTRVLTRKPEPTLFLKCLAVHIGNSKSRSALS